jgi:hypothetical protein
VPSIPHTTSPAGATPPSTPLSLSPSLRMTMSPLQCSLPHELAPSLSFSRTCHGAVARPSPPWVGAPASLPPGTSAPVPQPRCRGGAWARRRSGGEGLCPSICKEGQCSNWRCRGGARTLPPPATHKVHGVRHPHPRDLAPELSPAGRRGATPLSPILTPPPRSATQRIPAPPPSPWSPLPQIHVVPGSPWSWALP